MPGSVIADKLKCANGVRKVAEIDVATGPQRRRENSLTAAGVRDGVHSERADRTGGHITGNRRQLLEYRGRDGQVTCRGPGSADETGDIVDPFDWLPTHQRAGESDDDSQAIAPTGPRDGQALATRDDGGHAALIRPLEGTWDSDTCREWANIRSAGAGNRVGSLRQGRITHGAATCADGNNVDHRRFDGEAPNFAFGGQARLPIVYQAGVS